MLDIENARPRRRTALIDIELDSIGSDIAALQEVRLSGEGQLQEATRTFFWKGCPAGQPRRAGVAFAIKNEIASKLTESPQGISERLMTLRICLGTNRFITLVNVYAPTMTYPDEEKEAFYAQLRSIIAGVPRGDRLIILGDFNARVGNDHNTWSPALGKFGKGNQNQNGLLLACLCSEMDLAITNTYFKQPDKHFFTWTHPRSKRPHLLDYVITRRKDLKDIKNTRAMRGPDCNTDHYLVKTTLNFSLKPIYSRTKAQRKRRLDTTQLYDINCQEELKSAITSALRETQNENDSSQGQWDTMSKAVFNAAAGVLGFAKRKNADWFNENNEEIKELIIERNAALKQKLSNPTPTNVSRLKSARATLQRKLREMENNWWLHKAEAMQREADANNSAGFFKALKEVYGPQAKMSNTLLADDGRTAITEPSKLVGRWQDYFHTLLNDVTDTEEGILDSIAPFPQQQELDQVPTMEELRLAIAKTKMNKSPGNDGIPAEIYKFGGEELTRRLHQLIEKCWLERRVPQDFKDVLILPIFKNKGDHRDCSNYRGISLLVIAGKIMAKIIQTRLSKLAENVLTESQCGFRKERSTIDMIFSLRQIQEKSIEQDQELYMIFVDFRKAFDTVDRRMLWKVLKIFGCTETFVDIIRQFHDGTRGKVMVGTELSDHIDVNHGTKQGCVLAPTLFTLFLTIVLTILHQEVQEGVYIRTRSDGKLFNLARLKAKTKTRKELIRELLFADDTALVAHELHHIRRLMDSFSEAARKIGLKINTDKTEVMYQPSPRNSAPENPQITVNGAHLKVVPHFKYLGSTLSTDNRADKEIVCRIQSACASFGKLEKRLWGRQGIRLATKCKVYKAIVLPALLYSAETYTLYREHIKKLEAVQQRHLRRIMKIKWNDYIPNVEVLQRANMDSIEATLATTQLRWTGHVLRMNEERVPKQLLYGELERGKRRVGGQKLRYRDVVKRHLKSADINVEGWEALAADRARWRKSLHDGREAIQQKFVAASNQRHYRRHNPGSHVCNTCGKMFHTVRGMLQHQRIVHRNRP